MDSYWETPELEIGDVTEGQEIKFYFQAKLDIPPIWNIIPGCGCTQPRFDKETKRLHVTYTVGKLPRHFLHIDEQEIAKHFRIDYTDETSESITFYGNKIRL